MLPVRLGERNLIFIFYELLVGSIRRRVEGNHPIPHTVFEHHEIGFDTNNVPRGVVCIRKQIVMTPARGFSRLFHD